MPVRHCFLAPLVTRDLMVIWKSMVDQMRNILLSIVTLSFVLCGLVDASHADVCDMNKGAQSSELAVAHAVISHEQTFHDPRGMSRSCGYEGTESYVDNRTNERVPLGRVFT